MVKLIATGGRAGKSFTFREWRAEAGVILLPGNAASNEGVIHYLGRCLQAYPEGDSRIPENYGKHHVQAETLAGNPAAIPGNLQSSGEGTTPLPPDNQSGAVAGASGPATPVADGNGPENTGDDSGASAGDEVQAKVLTAVALLDHGNDDHWNQSGKPAVAAMQQLAGIPDLTRKELDTWIPTVVRNKPTATQS